MKHYLFRAVLCILFLNLFLVLPFQACAPLRGTEEEVDGKLDSSSLDPDSPQVKSGVELYNMHCASCHQPLDYRSKEYRSFTQIKSAILVIPEMNEIPSLLQLTNTEIENIAAALKLPPLPPAPPPDDGGGDDIPDGGGAVDGKPEVVFQQPLGNRKFIAAKLKSLFSGGNATINAAIDNWTTNKVGIFGSPCNRTMPQCSGDEGQNIIAPGIALGNVLRSAYRIKTCEYVLENDVAISNMLSQVGLTVASPRSESNLKIVSLALTNVTIGGAVIKDFQDIDAKLSGNALESWRMILLTFCKSTLFENF